MSEGQFKKECEKTSDKFETFSRVAREEEKKGCCYRLLNSQQQQTTVKIGV